MKTESKNRIALVLGGGGARAAYQAGFLRYIGRRLPDLRFSILSGTSAGAINTVHLARHQGSFHESVEDLKRLWSQLSVDQVFNANTSSLARIVTRWGLRLISGGSSFAPTTRGLVDTSPLRNFLCNETSCLENGKIPGIEENILRGNLRSLAITTTDYSTGRSVTWIHGKIPKGWERTYRSGIQTKIRLDHVMASCAIPLVFPAVKIGDSWHGDGGVRQTTPLSPVMHMGADRILAISTRNLPVELEPQKVGTSSYPPPAQVAGILMNAIFLDSLEFDSSNVQRFNRLLEKLPEEDRNGLRPVELLTARPSEDPGAMASEFEARLPGPFRFLERGLGTQEAESHDLLSLLMFQPEYLAALLELGEKDARERADEVIPFLVGDRKASIAL
ncbi:MAG: patatin-like phospholipase family protein [Planctomycetota bacterium]|nr:patatin-like phospholipase family protein [Planctomycetota bacterium]